MFSCFRNPSLLLILLIIICADPVLADAIAFPEIELRSGAQNIELHTTTDEIWKARISIPGSIDDKSERKYPLIIGLHWLAHGEARDPSYRRYSACLLEPALNDLEAFMISPQADEILWHTENNQIRVLTLVNEAKKHWPIDTERIVITGYSQGGVGSWFYAEKYPDIFSAAIPVASSYPNVADSSIEIPLFVIHSRRDETFPFKRIKKRIKEHRAKGTDVTFIKDSRLSHYKPCKYTRHLEKSVDWLNYEVWYKDVQAKNPDKLPGSVSDK
jgi:predicted peptidase